MQKLPSGSWRFSATDLIHFLECEHLTALDRTHAETPLDPVEDDAYAALIQAKSFEHENPSDAAGAVLLGESFFTSAQHAEPTAMAGI